MKHDELMPSRPGRRSWTRPEDYLPLRRLRRAASGQPLTARPAVPAAEAHGQDRIMLGLVPFVMLMLGLVILTVAIAVVAWPGRQPVAPDATKVAAAAPHPASSAPPPARR